jgi:hypothetical protein
MTTTFIQPDYTFGNSKDCQDQLIGVLQTLDQALQALEPSPASNTVQFNDTIILTDGSTNTNTINKNSIFIKDNSIGYTTTSAIEIENINSTLNNFVGVPSMEYYKSGRIGAPADIIMSQQFNALNYLGAKTTFGKIECSITSNNVPGSGGVDGAIDFYTCVNGSNNNVFRLNGQDNENNTFRPFDLNGNLLKTSQGNLILDATSSSGPGSVDITAKTGGVVNINSNVVMDNSESFIQRNATSTIYNNQTTTSVNLVDTSVGNIVNSNTNDNISQILTNDTSLQTLTNESYCNLQRVNKFDKTLNNVVEHTDIYSNRVLIEDNTIASNSQLYATSLNFSASQSGVGSNNIDIDANSFVYQTLITSSVNDTTNIYSTALQNNQSIQGIEFKLLTPTTDKLLQIGNATSSGGYITYANNLDTNPLVITSNTSMNLDTTTLNLVNTNTTASVQNHTSSLGTTSNIGDITNYLKLQLNGADIWIPYFTTDPSL